MLEDKCALAIRKFNMLPPCTTVIVGLSGGADSCALLHYLCTLRDELSLTLLAVHVNHMIRGEEAARDAAFAAGFCETLGVPFRLYQRDVPSIAAQRGIGLEQCGREIRYGILEDEAKKYGGRIATAHTLSDSVETVLFHLIRGSSVNGLKGIPPIRGNIIRPLITCERSEVEEYCARHGITYVTDSTNLTTDYARNKIRLQILPLMRELNPSVNDAIRRLSESAAEDDEFICGYSDAAAHAYLSTGWTGKVFSSKRPVMSRALIRICAERLHIVPEQKHVAAMCDAIGRGEGSVNLPGGSIFSVHSDGISFSKKQELADQPVTCQDWKEAFRQGEIMAPSGLKINNLIMDINKYNDYLSQNSEKAKIIFKNSLDYDTISEAVFRFRREGDRFSPSGRHCTKSLKKLFNEEKIPPGIRGQLPMLESGGMLAWISAVGVSERCKVTEKTARVLYIEVI